MDAGIKKRMKEVEQAVLDLDESVRGPAFTVMREYILSGDAGKIGGGSIGPDGGQKSPAKKSAAKSTAKSPTGAPPGVDAPDESTFFAQIADESGVGEKELRDVLRLTKGGEVEVVPPTRKLGLSKADQAKTVIVLVAGARALGLGEDPVDADAVRKEAKRKRCFDQNNFAAKALSPLDGFNAGSNRNEIVLGSKWVGEFKAVVDKVRGAKAAGSEE
jgi:hypothetical protein